MTEDYVKSGPSQEALRQAIIDGASSLRKSMGVMYAVGRVDSFVAHVLACISTVSTTPSREAVEECRKAFEAEHPNRNMARHPEDDKHFPGEYAALSVHGDWLAFRRGWFARPTPAEDAVEAVAMAREAVIERAEQACRYALKHQNFVDDDGTPGQKDYQEGFAQGAYVCEHAIRRHVIRHWDEDRAAIAAQQQGADGLREENERLSHQLRLIRLQFWYAEKQCSQHPLQRFVLERCDEALGPYTPDLNDPEIIWDGVEHPAPRPDQKGGNDHE